MAGQHHQYENAPRVQDRRCGILGVHRADAAGADVHRDTRACDRLAQGHGGPANLSPASIRRKLSALSSLFDYLCERNAVAGVPVDGVKRIAGADVQLALDALLKREWSEV